MIDKIMGGGGFRLTEYGGISAGKGALDWLWMWLEWIGGGFDGGGECWSCLGKHVVRE